MAHIEIIGREEYFDRTMRRRTCNVGRCSCGAEVRLIDLYMGACDCPNCGQWYNVGGEPLKDPDEWNDDGELYGDY